VRSEQEMLDLILKIAKEEKRIRALYMFGSRANPVAETDKFSDFDIGFIVTETEPFIKDKKWLYSFGDIAIVFKSQWNRLQFGLTGETIDFARRYIWGILFKDGNRIDLIIEIVEEAMKSVYVFGMPTIKLLDKDGVLPVNPASLTKTDFSAGKPDRDKYEACCTAFWWFLNDVAKRIVRNELPYAFETYNNFVRYTLNQMADWYIGIQSDFSVSAGRSNKYYKKYLPADFYNLYAETYSGCNYTSLWSAIFSGCTLFEELAVYVGRHYGFSYNKEEEDNMLEYLTKVKKVKE